MRSRSTDHESDTAPQGKRILLNWGLALLTVPAAIAVYLYAMASVMAMASCTGAACAEKGPNEFWFGIMLYGAPVVPIVCLALSVFTARLRRGHLVPLAGLTLLALDAVALAASFPS